jgi:hypothetical protein
MIQMPSGPGGDSPAQNAESIKIEAHNPPQVNLQKCQKKTRKAKTATQRLYNAVGTFSSQI